MSSRPLIAAPVLAGASDLPPLAALFGTLCVPIAYFAAALLGNALAADFAPVATLWAPQAVLAAALVTTRRRNWWLHLVTAVPAHMAASLALGELLLQQELLTLLANCGTAVIVGLAIPPLLTASGRFDSLRQAAVLVLSTAAASVATSALLAATFVVLGITPDFWPTVAVRSLTELFGVVTLVPLVVHALKWLRTPDHALPTHRVVEAVPLAACIGVAGIIVFLAPPPSAHIHPTLLYLPLPALLWAAIRFRVAGASIAVTALAGLATFASLSGSGPFVSGLMLENSVSLLLFLVLTCLPMFLLAVAQESSREQNLASESSSLLHSAVLNSLHDEIIALNNRGVVQQTNVSRHLLPQEATRAFEAVLVGDDYLAVCTRAAAAGDRIAAELRDAVRAILNGTAERRQHEFSVQSPTGIRWFGISIEPLRREEGGAVITRTEITERKRATVEAQDQRNQLAHLGRAAMLGELSGAFAHELNQPLTSILGNAEAALQLLAREPVDLVEVRDILRDIVQDDVRAADVIQRLRSLLAQGEIERRPVDLNRVIREVVELARSDLLTRSVTVQLQLDADAGSVLADYVQMQQVALNLVINACEAMSGLARNERVLVLATRFIEEERIMELTVADRGCGIPASDLERVFQPFVTTKRHGLGLGLPISRSIVEAHGGRLWAAQRADGGTMMHVTLRLDA